MAVSHNTFPKISENDTNLLLKNYWKWGVKCQIPYVKNTKTGCIIESFYAIKFLIDKLEELKEEQFPEPTRDFETVLEQMGYILVCESPLEIVDNNGNYITGECALWFKHIITH